MENSHNRAQKDASKILQSFFVIFVLVIVIICIVKIASHTDGTLVNADEDSAACSSATQELLEKQGVSDVVHCK